MHEWMYFVAYVALGLVVMFVIDVMDVFEDDFDGWLRITFLMFWPLIFIVPVFVLVNEGYWTLVRLLRKKLRRG